MGSGVVEGGYHVIRFLLCDNDDDYCTGVATINNNNTDDDGSFNPHVHYGG